jgi:hypothetical protein
MSGLIKILTFGCVNFYVEYYPYIMVGGTVIGGIVGYYDSAPYRIIDSAMLGFTVATLWPVWAGITVYSVLNSPAARSCH